MKVRCKKLLALLICVALSVTDILPVGFSVSARELEQSDLILENNEASVDNLLEKSVYESKSSTDGADFGEESVRTEEAIKEGITAEDTEVQEEGDDKNNIEIETQEESSLIEETENNNIESDASEEKTEQELNVATSDDDIASGKYEGITWVIDAQGKLTVTGTGEFIIGYKPEDGYEAGDSLWYDYSDSIVSAEINVTGAKNASNMFYGCSNLTNVDMSGFDTGNVISMGCMFYECSNLANVDMSSFDTRNVTNMGHMFFDCSSLTSVNVSSFNTANVTDMSEMFYGCSSLTSIDVSGFDTRNVEEMNGMFAECSSLTSIDVSGFDTRNVTYMNSMFADCSKLTYLDLSDFDLGNFWDEDEEIGKDVYGMLDGCINLTTIHTPCNLTQSVPLPKTESSDKWYQFDGTQITELPQNLGYSIIIAKNSIPLISEPYIVAEKEQTDYECTDILNLYDLKVMYFNVDGTIQEVYDYSTNKNEIDMSTTGVKTLKVIYNGLEATVKLYVKPKILIASGSYEGITWNINDKGKLIVQGIGDFAEPSTGGSSGSHSSADIDRAPWYTYKDSIKSAEIDVMGMTDASYMFNECYSLESIELNGLDTGSITDMGGMFCRCENLTRLDVSNFDTKNVTDMGAMFYRCENLTDIDVSGFDTSKVTNMSSMFGECLSLTNVDVSGFDTKNVTSMGSMFWRCISLINLDVSGFDTGKVTNMNYMFTGCGNLTSLDMSSFDISKVTDSSMFAGGFAYGECGITTLYTPCNVVNSVELPSGNWYQPDGTVITELPKNLPYSILITWGEIPTVSDPHIRANKAKKVYTCGDTLNTDDLTVRFYDTDGTVKAVTDYTTNADTIDMSTVGTKTLIITYNNLTTDIELIVTQADSENIASGRYKDITWEIDADGKLTVIGTGNFSDSTNYDRAPWFTYKDAIKYAQINITDMTDASYMFNDCDNLIYVDLSDFETGNVINMEAMFWSCGSLTNIDMSSFDTRNVTDMSNMFSHCDSLETLDLSGFDTRNVTDMSSMFSYCNSLETLDLSGFDTRNVTDMETMFHQCTSLTNIDVSTFDTSKVTNMHGMFGICQNLRTLDLSSFDTSKVTDTGCMFWLCYSLEALDLSGFDTSKVTSMYMMFNQCYDLTYLDVSSFDTKNVTDMRGMFSDCNSLETLDLSGFDTRNVIDYGTGIEEMFYCSNGITAIYTPCNVIDSVELPSGNWYQPDGTVITELPKNLPYSILITKNTIPTVAAPHIAANKAKNVYTCGDTLNTDDLTVRFYDTDGTVKAVTDYTTNADTIDMSTVGTKTLIITYNNLTAEIELTVTNAQQNTTYTVTFDLGGHGTEIKPITGITAGSLIAKPQPPVAEGYRFMGWYKDLGYTHEWNFAEDTVQENITLYAYWITAEEDTIKIGSLFIQKIPAQSYTGSAIKPTVAVYYQLGASKTLLKAGTDYTIKYYNNIEADTEQEKTLGGTSQTDTDNGFTKDLAYIVITCKGNYTGSVYQNFHIDPVSITGDGQNPAKGFTLKYTEQFANSTNLLKPFSSLKYKKAMKVGTDYNVKLTVQKAYDADGNVLTEGRAIDENSTIPAIPAGYQGTFLMTITGLNNYEGTITKTIYIADKNHLMKNASVSLGKNQKNMKYTGDAVTLTPAWCDVSAKKYYVISDDDTRTEVDKNDVFTIKLGTEYLLYGRDFTVGYQSNKAVGTATMTIVGIGDYVGTKNVTFRIMGTAFNAKNIRVSNMSASLIFTGEALTQNEVVLSDISGTNPKELVCNTDYTVSYKNNLKKGTATIIFTANPISGYSGSFKQTFKITTAGLSEITDVTAADLYNDILKTEDGSLRLEGKIIYTKEGAKPSERIVLTNRNTNSVLKEGTDYTVSYVNNKTVTTDSSLATMTIKGKGNYAGIITVSYPIITASLTENENIMVTTVPMAYNAKKADDYQYRPQIKLMDQKKALSASKDYEVVEYKNCSQSAVKAYLEDMVKGTATVDKRPYAIIKAREESGYEGYLEVDLTIYQTKLSAKNLYIVVSAEKEQVTYTGKQVKPEVTVYYGEAEAVQQAKNAEETKENILTDKLGSYKLTKLDLRENGIGDYTLTYGENITAGKNKGTITVNGAGLYGGKVTVKFTILGKNVHNTNIEKMKGAVALSAQLLLQPSLFCAKYSDLTIYQAYW